MLAPGQWYIVGILLLLLSLLTAARRVGQGPRDMALSAAVDVMLAPVLTLAVPHVALMRAVLLLVAAVAVVAEVAYVVRRGAGTAPHSDADS